MSTKNVLSMYSKTVLVVDDVPLFIKMASDFFRREQAIVKTASGGREAVELARQIKPDLVLMDMYMPGGDGDEACREIKNDLSLRSTPVIIMTSSATPNVVDRCRQAGCDDLLPKPITRENLMSVCRKYIKLPGWSGERVKIDIPAKYGEAADKPFTGVISDISVGGIFLETEKLLPMGSVLHLEFQLSPGGSTLQCQGRVAWVNRNPAHGNEKGKQGMGIEFIDIRKLDLMAIMSWLGKAKKT